MNLVTAIGIFLLLPQQAFATSPNALMTSPPGSTAPGGEFVSDVKFAVPRSVSSHQEAIQYDRSVLTFVDAVTLFPSQLIPGLLCNDTVDTSGMPRGILLCVGDVTDLAGVPPVSGIVSAVRVTFRVNGTATASSTSFRILAHTTTGAPFERDFDTLVYDAPNGNEMLGDFGAPVVSQDGTAAITQLSDSGDVTGLTLAKAGGNDLALTWNPSCRATDMDDEIYQGLIGAWGSHVPYSCTTNGATTATVSPTEADTYYLVVPRNVGFEGSYGRNGSHLERPASSLACLQQAIGVCP
jgi:hypothetical protein